jgi:copper/silver efflux system protein
MLNRLIAWSLRNRVVVLSIAALMLAAGAWTASRMPVDVFPDLTAPTVTVLTEAHGMAPEEVESLVTFPIETAVNGSTGVRRVRSSTAQGISVVWVEFDWGIDIFRARQTVAEKLQSLAAALPTGVAPPQLAPVSSVMGEIMMIGLVGPQSRAELRTVADWTIRRRLLAVPGVAQIIPIGGEVKQYQVLADPGRMVAAGVTLAEVVRAARGSNENASGGVFMHQGQEYVIRGIGRAQSVGDIGATVVAMRGGVPVTIDQVATVVIGPAPSFGDASVNAKDAIVLAVQKQPGANTLELTTRIERELADLQRALPPGMRIEGDLFRQSDFIAVAVANVMKALRDGALLVVVILFLFLWNFRTTAISIVAIPLSLVVAIFAMKLLGITINTMSLGGMAIAIGALVDDAIIDVENVFRRLKENHQRAEPQRRPTLQVIYDASREIRASIVNATLIIIVVFLPLFFLGGVEARLLRPLGFAYVVSILASLLVAVTVTPVLCAYLLPSAKAILHGDESALVRWLKRHYERVLRLVLAHPRRVLGAAAATLLISVTATPFLGSAFLPEFNEGALTVSVVTVPGTSLAESNAIGRRVERILLAHPAVKNTDRRQGRAELDEHAQGVNAAEIDVTLNPEMDKETLLEDLRREFAVIPGTSVTIGQPIGHRIDHMLSGTRANIAVKVFGPDLYRLRQVGAEVRSAMESVPGVADLQLEQQMDVPQLRIRADRQAMARFGMTVGELAEAIDIGFNGETVSQVMEDGRSHDLVVRFPPELRATPEAIASVAFDTPTGQVVPLSQLATVTVDRGPNAISRENVQRKIVVQANVAGRDLGSTVEEIRETIGRTVTLPAGYHVEYGGQFEAQEESTRTLGALSLLAIAAIFLILFAEFRSARTAGLVMANLPLAVVGGVAAVWLTGGVVTVASLVGFVTLFGIATRNGILLVAHYRHLLAEGVPFREAIFQGSVERLSPILMTALTAGLALIPLALGGGEPGNELQTPMAIVILGGLLSATALNMVVLPALYLLYGDRHVTAPMDDDILEPNAPLFPVPRATMATMALLVAGLLTVLPSEALAHGVASGDKGYIQSIVGVHLIPFAYLGAKHMVTGYDHLLFLLGVIFFLYRLKDVGVYVTLFAIGHSTTLLLGVLTGVSVSAYLIDAIIGLSVVYKALDNLGAFRAWFGVQPNAKIATLVFGLFHGFGLATKILDFELSPAGLVPNLLAFNVGVEIGQLLALGAILTVMTHWRKRSSFARHAYTTNVIVMGAGFVLMGYQLAGYFIL